MLVAFQNLSIVKHRRQVSATILPAPFPQLRQMLLVPVTSRDELRLNHEFRPAHGLRRLLDPWLLQEAAGPAWRYAPIAQAPPRPEFDRPEAKYTGS